MQAVRCQTCKLLVGEGDYGGLKIAAASWHFPVSDGEGIALAAEGKSDEIEPGPNNDEAGPIKPCQGSEMLGHVEEVPV